jgi:hypothetical protein
LSFILLLHFLRLLRIEFILVDDWFYNSPLLLFSLFCIAIQKVFLVALYVDGAFSSNNGDDDDDDDKVDDDVGSSDTWWLVLLPAMVYICLLCGRCTNARLLSKAELAAAAKLEEEPLPPEATFKVCVFVAVDVLVLKDLLSGGG